MIVIKNIDKIAGYTFGHLGRVSTRSTSPTHTPTLEHQFRIELGQQCSPYNRTPTARPHQSEYWDYDFIIYYNMGGGWDAIAEFWVRFNSSTDVEYSITFQRDGQFQERILRFTVPYEFNSPTLAALRIRAVLTEVGIIIP